MYRSWSTMLSFRDAGHGCCVETESMRRVSGALSHRMGLDAELSEPDLSERVAWDCFSKVHCWSCAAMVTSAMFLVDGRKQEAMQWSSDTTPDGVGNIIRAGAATGVA
jgi:hypothetical protein